MKLDAIYTQLITENSRSTRHKHAVSPVTFTKRGHNPSCGDDITISVRVTDGILEDLGFDGVGCAISQASVTMMIDLVKGKSIAEAVEIVKTFLDMITGSELSEDKLDTLEDAQALSGVAKMPARVKCAVLAWRTLEGELAKLEN